MRRLLEYYLGTTIESCVFDGDVLLPLFAKLYDDHGHVAAHARLTGFMPGSSWRPGEISDYRNDGDLGDAQTYRKCGTKQSRRTGQSPARNDLKTALQLILKLGCVGSAFFCRATRFNRAATCVHATTVDYDMLDLETLPTDYLPRTNYFADAGST